MIKQVIVIRRDLGMRRGKEISQGSHASIAWLSNRLRKLDLEDSFLEGEEHRLVLLSKDELEWLDGYFTKVTLQVQTVEEIERIETAAIAAGIRNVHKITDCGHTEFNGVPTVTCIALGPDLAEKIDAVTGNLKLY